MPDSSPTDTGEAALRSRRLSQFAALLFVAFTGTALHYGFQHRWDVVLILVTAALLMLPSQWLNHRGHQQASAVVILGAATLALSCIMWRSDGLRDSSLLGFPVILIAAGQLLKPRQFWWLLTGMVLSVLLVGLGTLHGWRSETTPGTDLDRLTDSLTILLVNGVVVWFMAYDMQKALARLRVQIARYRESEKNLTHLAQHDALTHLPNRILGSELVEQAIATSARHQQLVALLFVDLDNFKDVNDSVGHSAGDEFLQQVALRLRDAVRHADIVCRQGGDEFLVGVTGVTDTQGIAQAAAQVLQRMQEPFHLRGLEILASCSIGIAVHPKDGATFEELLRHADLAMYQAKESGRNAYRFFDEEINTSIRENLHLISSLRQAIAQNELVLHYQPVFDLGNDALVGAEALVRWQNPKLGLVSPGLFIPVAEKSGLIVDIGQWVLQEACRQMRAWRMAGAPPLRVAVNLSPVQFRRGDVEAIIERVLQQTGLAPEQLELEVTESTLIQDTEKFVQTLQRIKAMGIHLAIDDFGTGYSNLSYLQRFSVDKLKIDQSFVRRLLDGEKDVTMVSAIIHLAKSLNLMVTAEGVENVETRDALKRMDCDQAQGYWFAKPMPAAQFEAFWRKQLAAPAMHPGVVPIPPSPSSA